MARSKKVSDNRPLDSARVEDAIRTLTALAICRERKDATIPWIDEAIETNLHLAVQRIEDCAARQRELNQMHASAQLAVAVSEIYSKAPIDAAEQLAKAFSAYVGRFGGRSRHLSARELGILTVPLGETINSRGAIEDAFAAVGGATSPPGTVKKGRLGAKEAPEVKANPHLMRGRTIRGWGAALKGLPKRRLSFFGATVTATTLAAETSRIFGGKFFLHRALAMQDDNDGLDLAAMRIEAIRGPMRQALAPVRDVLFVATRAPGLDGITGLLAARAQPLVLASYGADQGDSDVLGPGWTTPTAEPPGEGQSELLAALQAAQSALPVPAVTSIRGEREAESEPSFTPAASGQTWSDMGARVAADLVARHASLGPQLGALKRLIDETLAEVAARVEAKRIAEASSRRAVPRFQAALPKSQAKLLELRAAGKNAQVACGSDPGEGD